MSNYVELQALNPRTEKLPPIRKAIARNLKNAMDKVAYCALTEKLDATNLWNFRKSVVTDVQDKEGVKLTFLSWIIKATTIALSENPVFSAKVNEETLEITYPDQLNIGIAVDTPAGLVVPVIKGADKLSIVEIQKEIKRLAGLARDKKLKMSDMQGGCFTISNVGTVGVLHGSPIMNYPELAIMATGAIIDEVMVKDGAIVPGKAMYMSIAADHRWVDGADMGRLLQRIIKLLEEPEKLGEL